MSMSVLTGRYVHHTTYARNTRNRLGRVKIGAVVGMRRILGVAQYFAPCSAVTCRGAVPYYNYFFMQQLSIAASDHRHSRILSISFMYVNESLLLVERYTAEIALLKYSKHFNVHRSCNRKKQLQINICKYYFRELSR